MHLVLRGLRAAASTPRKLLRLDVAGIVFGLAIGAFLIASQFPAGGNDDSHITYWVAHDFSTEGRIANYNGLRVEQSSSLGLVVLLGLFEWISGLATPLLGWLTSLLLGALTVCLAPLLASTKSKHAVFWAPVLLGTWFPFLYWSTSGMEMTLVTALGCAVALVAGRFIDSGEQKPRRWLLVGFVGTAFVVTRPETPIELVCMLALATLLLAPGFLKAVPEADRHKARRAVILLAGAAALVFVVVLLRYVSFGLFAPHPAIAKSASFAPSQGASYLWQGMFLAGPVLALVALPGAFFVVGGLRKESVPTRSLLLLGWFASALAFVVGSGGDWMPGARLLVPLAPALAVLAAEAIGAFGRWNVTAGHVAGAVIAVLNVTSALSFGSSRENGSYRGAEAKNGERALVETGAATFSFSELANRAHRRDARLLGPLLGLLRRLEPTPEEPVYLMSGQAGMVPYYVFREFRDKVRFIDLYALTTPEILPCIPRRQRKHQVQGIRLSPGYVIDHADRMGAACGVHRPHIVFSTGLFPDYLSKRGYERFYQGPRGMDAFVAVDRKTLRDRGDERTPILPAR